MCRALIKILSFFLKKLEEYLESQLMKTQAKLNAAVMPHKASKASSKIDLVGNIILLITSIGLMFSSYFVTSWIITLTHSLK